MNNLTINLSNQKFRCFTFALILCILSIPRIFAQGSCTPATNPTFPTECDFCVIVVLDESGSTSSIATEIKNAMIAFAGALNDPCLDVNMAIVEYGSTARVADIGGTAGFSYVNTDFVDDLTPYFDGTGNSASTYNSSGGTNWDHGLQVAKTLADSAPCANPYIVMFTDGNPTYAGATANIGNGSSTTAAVLEAACNSANALKNGGNRIFTVALPNPTLVVSNVQAIENGSASLEYVSSSPGSGQTDNIRLADYLVTSQANVGTAFAALAAGIAAPTISTTAVDTDFVECNPTIIAPTFTVNHDCQNNATPTVATDGPIQNGCSYSQTWTASYAHTGVCPAVAQDVSITYTWTQDTEAPVITNCPTEAIDLGDNPTLPTVADAENAINTTDNCGIKSKVAIASSIETIDCVSTQTFLVTVTDNCGQTATCNVVYTWTKDCCVKGATCNLTNINEEDCDIPVAYTEPTDVFSDIEACGTVVTMDHTDDGDTDVCGNGADFTRTYTLYFDGQAFKTCEQTININTPVLELVGSCPGDPNLDGCADYIALDDAWITWINGLNAITASGGCNAIVEYSTPIQDLVKPSVCTTSQQVVTIEINAKDDCGETSPITCTFTVGAYADDLLLSDVQSVFSNTCDYANQAELDTAFATFLSGFGFSGGCSPVGVFEDTYTAPDICTGGFVNVQYNVTDTCDSSGDGAFFVVDPPSTALVISDVQSTAVQACTYANQDELNDAFNTWLAGFTVSGGCNPIGSFADTYVAPDLCAGGSVDVTYTVTDLCQNGEDTATFTVNASAPVAVSCPAPVALGSSLTEQEIIDAYTAWKAGFTVSGGCNPTDNLSGFPSLPNYDCGTGVDLSFTLDASDRCGSDSCSSTFTVEGVTGLTVSCPAPVSLDACATQDEIEAAYNTWVSGFAVNDGDNPTSNIGDIPTLDAFACGGAVGLSFTLTAVDGCNPNGVSCSSTFNVAAAEELVVECPAPVSLNSPVTLQEIEDAYNAWVAGFGVSGGCNASSNMDNIPVLPDYICGQAIDLSFDLEATDDCGTKSCSSSFYVEPTNSVEAGDDGSLIICKGDTVTAEDLFAQLTLADAGGVWSPTPSGAGTYTYTVYGTYPCPNDTAIVEVTEHEVTIVAEDPVCGEVEGFGFYSVNVSTNEGIVTSDYGTPTANCCGSWTVSNIPNGQNVTVTVTTDLQCESSLEIVAPECACIELDYDYTDVSCFGLDDGTITVNYVSEGATVTINGEPYDPDMLYVPGSYTIKAFYEGVDIDECIIEEKIDIKEPALVTIDAVGTDVTCYNGDDGTITINNLSEGAVYTIKKNGLGPDLSGQDYFRAGMYIVKAFLPQNEPSSGMNDGSNRTYDPCEAIVIVTIGEPEMLACKIFSGFGTYVECKPTSINNWIGVKTTVQGNLTYSWSIDKKGMDNGWGIKEDNPEKFFNLIVGKGSAIYTVAIEDEKGCFTTCSIKVISSCNVDEPANVSVYPNPVKELLTVKFDKKLSSDVTVEVYNLVGTKMFAKTYSVGAKAKSDSKEKEIMNDMKIDFSKFPSQVYYVKIITENGTIIKKVVLDK